MSAVTSQPLPFDRLEREKHIQMIFSAFQNRCGPSCQCHRESDEQLSGLTPGRKTEHMHPPRKVKRPGVEEQWPGGVAGSHFMSVLETVSQIHVTARPELQGEQEERVFVCFCEGDLSDLKGWCCVTVGPQCVPRRIYSITAGGSRSQLIVAVEGTDRRSATCVQTELTHPVFISHEVTDDCEWCWFSLFSPSCQRAPACVSSVVVRLGPVPCRASTVRAARSFILKGPSGWTPAASAAAWWRWGPTHLRNILLAASARGTVWICFYWQFVTLRVLCFIEQAGPNFFIWRTQTEILKVCHGPKQTSIVL